MPKSNAKRHRNNFVRGLRAEVSINAYTRALGYVQTRSHDQAVLLLRERIEDARRELADVHAKKKTGATA